jgi:LPXTG-site transpeptidase (sortase) family protein
VSEAPTSTSKQSKIGLLLITLGILLGCVTAFLLLNNSQEAPKPPPGALTSKSAPSSVRPKAQTVTSYAVPPTDPKYINIPAIGVAKTRIIQLGLLSNGSIAVPDNIYDTGWYNGSAKPGQNGAMFIYGHVSSWTANGVFYNLKKLKPGDTITVIRGDNTSYTYQVMQTRVYAYNAVPMNIVLAPVDSSKPGLNLMTCTGQIIKGTSEFNQRLVVYASLISSS